MNVEACACALWRVLTHMLVMLKPVAVKLLQHFHAARIVQTIQQQPERDGFRQLV
jgi:hypothetical protein